MDLCKKFEEMAETVRNLKTRPTDDEMLDIYGLYKQAMVGDVTSDKPTFFDFKGKSKWEAWKKCKGISKESAMNQYIAKGEQLIEKYGKA
ncbi:unnamed protein product [Soboliphyme baturini]|uniref:ACB domain-containing protein n=1 Tax=Soboliphyme baturini TaxID=241478 RepID=A0A183IN51_9BILA|nr:unnamed protein product [Soboliphyme baturini]